MKVSAWIAVLSLVWVTPVLGGSAKVSRQRKPASVVPAGIISTPERLDLSKLQPGWQSQPLVPGHFQKKTSPLQSRLLGLRLSVGDFGSPAAAPRWQLPVIPTP